jgi:aminopeptidase N
MLDFAQAAEHGGDRQLAFTRAFVLSACSADHLDIVQGLLDGSQAWPGLVVDTDLRWFMLQRLAAHDRIDEARIDAELASDDTAAGRRQAAVARASRPTMQARSRHGTTSSIALSCPMPSSPPRWLASRSQPSAICWLPSGIATSRSCRASGTSGPVEMAQEITVGLYPVPACR